MPHRKPPFQFFARMPPIGALERVGIRCTRVPHAVYTAGLRSGRYMATGWLPERKDCRRTGQAVRVVTRCLDHEAIADLCGASAFRSESAAAGDDNRGAA